MNKDDPAFPCRDFINLQGLTKREYFAIKCLQGIVNSESYAAKVPNYAARKAVRYADELIELLELVKKQEVTK